jgi:hypothetical protein
MTCIEQGKIHLPSNGFAIAGKIAVHSLTIIVALTIVFFLWQEHGAFTLISLVLAIYRKRCFQAAAFSAAGT